MNKILAFILLGFILISTSVMADDQYICISQHQGITYYAAFLVHETGRQAWNLNQYYHYYLPIGDRDMAHVKTWRKDGRQKWYRFPSADPNGTEVQAGWTLRFEGNASHASISVVPGMKDCHRPSSSLPPTAGSSAWLRALASF